MRAKIVAVAVVAALGGITVPSAHAGGISGPAPKPPKRVYTCDYSESCLKLANYCDAVGGDYQEWHGTDPATGLPTVHGQCTVPDGP